MYVCVYMNVYVSVGWIVVCLGMHKSKNFVFWYLFLISLMIIITSDPVYK